MASRIAGAGHAVQGEVGWGPGHSAGGLDAGAFQSGGAVGAGVDGGEDEGDDLGGAGDGDGPGVGPHHAVYFADFVHLLEDDGVDEAGQGQSRGDVDGPGGGECAVGADDHELRRWNVLDDQDDDHGAVPDRVVLGLPGDADAVGNAHTVGVAGTEDVVAGRARGAVLGPAEQVDEVGAERDAPVLYQGGAVIGAGGAPHQVDLGANGDDYAYVVPDAAQHQSEVGGGFGEVGDRAGGAADPGDLAGVEGVAVGFRVPTW